MSQIYPHIPNGKYSRIGKDKSEFTHKVRLVEYVEGMEDDNESLVRNKSK